LVVYLKEDYENKWAPVQAEEEEIPPVEEEAEVPATFGLKRALAPVSTPSIEGPNEVYPYDIISYNILNATGGRWLLSNKRARIKSSDDSSATIEIITGRSGSVSLIYRIDGMEDIIFNINILSL
jgi:hypothetical protein